MNSIRFSFLLRILAVVGTIVLVGLHASHAGEQFLARSWHSEDGLPSNGVRSVVQAADGFLWVATAEGVARFDGVRFVGFSSEPDATLSRTDMRALFPMANGEVWVTSRDGRLMRGKGSRLREVPIAVGNATGRDALISQVFYGSADVVFIVRGPEVWSVVGEQNPQRIERTPDVDALVNADAAHWEERGRGVMRSDPLRLRGSTERTWIFDTADGLRIAVGDAPGVPVEVRGNTLPNSVNEMIEDREGNLWLATAQQGLWQVRARRVEVLTAADGLSDHRILPVLEDRAGALWVATMAGGLDRLFDGKIAHFEVPNAMGRPVSALCEAQDGTMWAATREGSVFQGTDGDFRPIFTVATGVTKVVTILEDGQGRIWFGGRLGLAVWDGGEPRQVALSPSKSVGVTALAHDGADGIWVGTEGGQVFRGSETQWESIATADVFGHRAISSILPDADGNQWVGTLGGGLFLLRDGIVTPLTDGVNGGEPMRVTTILDDRTGHLWLGSLRGIFRFDRAALLGGDRTSVPVLNLDSADGLLTQECMGGVSPAGVRAKDGSLWIPTSNGLVHVLPEALELNSIPPPVVIEQMRVGVTVFDNPAISVSVGPGRSRLEFRYTALSFTAPEKVRFRTRLEGLENEWRDMGSQRTVAYESVPPGRYRFRVIAANGDGIWNETGDTFAVRVTPHYWETRWFQGAMAVLSVAIAVGVGALISRARMRGRLLRLELKSSREAERARIAQDLHDDLGASLTEISILAHLAAEERGVSTITTAENPLPEIAAKAQALVGALDEIVWAVNPKHDSLGSLVEYIIAFAGEFLRVSGIAFRVDVPRSFPDFPLDADHRHGVFLAVREVLNNAVKHAAATEVRLRIQTSARLLEIVIEDNGRGFDADTVTGGDGLGNLRKRLARLGGECRIESREAAGTTVRLGIPMP